MKKLIAGIAAVMILVCGCTAAFAAEQAVTREDAVREAMERVALSEENVTSLRTKEAMDDGQPVWIVDFLHDGCEYQFGVNALTGHVIEMSVTRLADPAAGTDGLFD